MNVYNDVYLILVSAHGADGDTVRTVAMKMAW